MSESYDDFLSPEDLQAIDAIVEGSMRRQMGQQLLDLMTSSEARQQGSDKDPFIELLNRAHETKAREDNRT